MCMDSHSTSARQVPRSIRPTRTERNSANGMRYNGEIVEDLRITMGFNVLMKIATEKVQ